jgi:hypothetical protein
MKRFQALGVLFISLISAPDDTFSQDILYKKDTTVLKVNIKDFDGQTIIYQLPGDSLGITYHLSKSVLDSLRYNGGKSLDLTYSSNLKESPLKMLDRNYLSTEIINLALGKASLDYERLSETGKTGFVIGLLINFKSQDWNNGYERGRLYYCFNPHYFFIRAGVNLYPFNHSLVSTGITRLSTGFSGLIGSYRKINYNDYFYDGTNYTYNYDPSPVLAAGIMWNIKERIYLGDHFQLTGSLEISLFPPLAFFCPELGLSVSF